MTPILEAARRRLHERANENWDSDEDMPAGTVSKRPIAEYAQILHAQNPRALQWLTYACARRVLPCWEVNSRSHRPRILVEQVAAFLNGSHAALDWQTATTPTPSPHADCRFSEMAAASGAVANCAKYLHTSEPAFAVYCISDADLAYDHVLVDHDFRRWLIEVAIPAVHEGRDLTPSEHEALRPPAWHSGSTAKSTHS